MAVKGTVARAAPVDVAFVADLNNSKHAYVDHYPSPTNGTDTVFADVPAGATSNTVGTLRQDSRRFYVEYNLTSGDTGVLTVSQGGKAIATGQVPDGDTFWLFGVT